MEVDGWKCALSAAGGGAALAEAGCMRNTGRGIHETRIWLRAQNKNVGLGCSTAGLAPMRRAMMTMMVMVIMAMTMAKMVMVMVMVMVMTMVMMMMVMVVVVVVMMMVVVVMMEMVMMVMMVVVMMMMMMMMMSAQHRQGHTRD